MKRELLMGDEAIALAAFEAGVEVVAAYPGTPSTQIPETAARFAKQYGAYVEFSTNEKVALEVGIGASWSGKRALVTMKHVGVNVASDSLMTLAYTGVDGGLVLVSADEPDCHSSQNEQDNRILARFANVPCLEPSSPQEARDMTIFAYDLSELFSIPVILRPTTRVCHARGDVELGEITIKKREGKFTKDVNRYVAIPAHARVLHKKLLEKMEKIREFIEDSNLDYAIPGEGKTGIIVVGGSFSYLMEALNALNINPPLLKIGISHPLARNKVLAFIKDLDKVIVVEELEPVIENDIKILISESQLNLKIYGKNIFPRTGEFSTELVTEILSRFFRIEVSKEQPKNIVIPNRTPLLCAGCPHRSTFYAIKKVTRGKAIFPSDIGCYTLGFPRPLQTVDTCISMGGSFGIACGFAKSLNEPIVATLGDSTFFHAGIPPLINAKYNNSKIVAVILDNLTTAMTGHQPHPGTQLTAMGDPAGSVSIEKLIAGMDIPVEVVNALDVKSVEDAVKRGIESKQVYAIVSRAPCVLLKGIEKKPIYRVEASMCRACKACIKLSGCPGLEFRDGHSNINSAICTGCGLCAYICPVEAIVR
ncbi:MAG: hydrogenase MvhADGHdrABC CoB-CoM heterodisulfide reductase subunit A [Candidatus Methanofastidiosum methylothiophilum]|uniref:Indolepyruvate oxidoreductase subunit IorA n=1 Tax=Candidatus Methanofastidiosum methylothiophilum TaxID=1705564 RepID=A0A150ITU4_9EURY|nr:MAG: hydrogenase MvhADGHdrABC CoB-CoM heterodisulfide reductase subunit A [Candidatus Methanofastidiosum methylthiophilus]KYC48074.1 MAG: hydrogenase MvhADGHdrABC CoB-CoM heterodisulfide reductase subunit A [Candidatus Methanofastidiosum methylthiophilus]KYC50465.1 MAG: hydrogenase MvhADGHdrABC CoB-CoM heterodisulfide reductase subunit A [Candidatus Methanofastidiosum methylthiophilus]